MVDDRFTVDSFLAIANFDADGSLIGLEIPIFAAVILHVLRGSASMTRIMHSEHTQQPSSNRWRK